VLGLEAFHCYVLHSLDALFNGDRLAQKKLFYCLLT